MSEPADIGKRIQGADIVAFPKASENREGARSQEGSGDAPPRDHAPDEPRKPEPARKKSSNNGAECIESLNDEFALAVMGSKCVVLREQPGAPVEDRVKILSVEAFGQLLANRSVRIETDVLNKTTGEYETQVKYTALAPYWMKSSSRRTYDGVEFYPDPAITRHSGNAAERGANPKYFNLWRGFDVMPDVVTIPRARREKYSVFYDHLLTNICNGVEEHCDWIFAWFAQMVQRPRQRIGTSIIMRGGEGTGKTKIGEVIGSLFKSHYFLVDDSRYLTGNFNAHMASCILLQVDEGFWAGDKGAEGRLKGLITAPMQMIESKGIDPIRLANYVRVIFTSNEEWVVPVGLDGRRYAVFDVGNNVQRNADYFACMEAELDSGGREALLADLLDYNLDALDAPNIRDVPKTVALLEQKIRSFDPVTSWWFQRLADGTSTHRAGVWRPRIPVITLFNDYVRTAERVGVKRKAAETEFGIRMHKLVPSLTKSRSSEEIEITGSDGRSETVTRRVWCFNMPSLDACRDAFEIACGQAVVWNANEVSDDGEPEGGAVRDFSADDPAPY